MLSRSDWIADFVSHVLRRGLSDDPDWVLDSANELYSEFGDLDPGAVADSAFAPEEPGPGLGSKWLCQQLSSN